VHHEKNGVASVLQGFQNVSAQLASKHQLSIPSSVGAHEQGLQFVSHDHPFLQGTVFGVPSAQYAIAASPDAKLVGGGSEMLLEVKCVCPFVEKDDGRGWVWLPFKRAPEGVSVKHFCAMPSANAGYKCFALSASSLGCTRVQSFLCAI